MAKHIEKIIIAPKIWPGIVWENLSWLSFEIVYSRIVAIINTGTENWEMRKRKLVGKSFKWVFLRDTLFQAI